MSRLRMLQGLIATVMLSAGLAVVPTVAAGTTQTFTGKVSDAMCGAKHTEGLAPAACESFPPKKLPAARRIPPAIPIALVWNDVRNPFPQ